jgi:hypothetical protein
VLKKYDKIKDKSELFRDDKEPIPDTPLKLTTTIADGYISTYAHLDDYASPVRAIFVIIGMPIEDFKSLIERLI